MTDHLAIMDSAAPSFSLERAARSYHEERIPLSPPLPDRDIRWRWAVAILAAILLHIGVVTTIDDGFQREKPRDEAPVPVEIVTEQPKPPAPPPPPPEPKPLEKPPEQPQQPLPYMSSNGEVEDKPSGSIQPKPEIAEQRPETTPALPEPEQQETKPEPKPEAAPILPDSPSPEAIPVPPPAPRVTQQAVIAAPVPPKKPPAPPAQQSVGAAPPQSQASPSSATTAEDPNVGEGGYNKYLRAAKEKILGNFYFPPTAEMFGVHGTAVYDITLDRNGEVRRVELVETSGASLLDKAGFNAIMRSSPFGPIPVPAGVQAVVMTLTMPMGEEN